MFGGQYGGYPPARLPPLRRAVVRCGRLRRLDWVLLGAVLALSGLGTLLVWSATRPGLVQAGGDPEGYLKKHLDEAVAEGHLTKPQETEMLAHLEQGIRAMVNGAPPDGMPRPGFGFRHGSDQGPSFDGPPTFDGAAA